MKLGHSRTGNFNFSLCLSLLLHHPCRKQSEKEAAIQRAGEGEREGNHENETGKDTEPITASEYNFVLTA